MESAYKENDDDDAIYPFWETLWTERPIRTFRIGRVILAPVARRLQHRQRLRALEELWAHTVLAAVAPHVHLYQCMHALD